MTHLLSTERLPFTAAYFGSIALTLYFALGVSAFWTAMCNALIIITASQHVVDIDLLDRPAGLSAMVYRELLPDGLNRNAFRSATRRQPCCGLDEQLVLLNASRCQALIMFCVLQWLAERLTRFSPTRDPHE